MEDVGKTWLVMIGIFLVGNFLIYRGVIGARAKFAGSVDRAPLSLLYGKIDQADRQALAWIDDDGFNRVLQDGRQKYAKLFLSGSGSIIGAESAEAALLLEAKGWIADSQLTLRNARTGLIAAKVDPQRSKFELSSGRAYRVVAPGFNLFSVKTWQILDENSVPVLSLHNHRVAYESGATLAPDLLTVLILGEYLAWGSEGD